MHAEIARLHSPRVTSNVSLSARTTTRHSLSVQTSWVSAPGDFTGAATFTPDTTLQATAFVAGLDVVNPSAAGYAAMARAVDLALFRPRPRRK